MKVDEENKYAIEKLGEVAAVRFFVKADAEVIREAITKIAKICPSGARLWDLGSEGMDVSAEDLRAVAEYAKTIFTPPSFVAIVAHQDLSFGLSRMYEAFRNENSTHIRVFTSEPDGLAWLSQVTDAN